MAVGLRVAVKKVQKLEEDRRTISTSKLVEDKTSMRDLINIE